MDWYCTEIQAVDPKTGTLKFWCGPNVQSISFDLAQQWCEENGLGYCKVIGRVDSEYNENGELIWQSPKEN